MLGFILWFGLSLGLQEGKAIVNRQEYILNPITASVDIHLENNWLDLYAVYKNEMGPCEWEAIGFFPYRDTYTVGAKVAYKQISMSIEHMCAHPVDPYNRNTLPQYDSWHNKIEIRITSKDQP